MDKVKEIVKNFVSTVATIAIISGLLIAAWVGIKRGYQMGGVRN